MIRNPMLFGSGGGTVAVQFKYQTGSSKVSGTIFYTKDKELQQLECAASLISQTTKTVEADSGSLIFIQFTNSLSKYSVVSGGTFVYESNNTGGSTFIIQAN